VSFALAEAELVWPEILRAGGEHGGVLLTVVLGIAGAVVGGFISTHMLGLGDVTGFDLRSMVIAVGGALLVLVVYGVFSRRRT
jgi:uncharacterized membrane protein YeaQ/YmgE (transglycosylase-associated protein family)